MKASWFFLSHAFWQMVRVCVRRDTNEEGGLAEKIPKKFKQEAAETAEVLKTVFLCCLLFKEFLLRRSVLRRAQAEETICRGERRRRSADGELRPAVRQHGRCRHGSPSGRAKRR